MAFSPSFNNVRQPASTSLDNSSFYAKVMAWVAASFFAAFFGAIVVGPMVPPAMMMPLYAVAFIALMVAGFSRKAMALSGVFAIGVPAILGIILYPTVNYYISSGAGSIVAGSAVGTAIIFSAMAIAGWMSKKSLSHNLMSKLFFVMLGLIAVSFLNAFLFHMTIIQVLISVAVIAIMCLYTFSDVQRLRDRNPYDEIPAAHFALNLFLNIYNIFVSLLNILGLFRN